MKKLLTFVGLVLATPAAAQIQTGTYLDAGGTPRGVAAVQQFGGQFISPGQVSVGTTATPIVPARKGRLRLQVSVGAANTCAFGPAGVTTTTGYALQPVAGASTVFYTGAALYAACSSTTTISYMEEF